MNYDQWLEAPFQEAEARAEAIDSATEALLDDDDYNPHHVDNFLDAIESGCLSEKHLRDEIEKAIAVGQSGFEAIGKVVWNAVHQYCYDRAASTAARQYDTRDYDDF